jgi:DNA-binding CsgD family transcriptional regulator
MAADYLSIVEATYAVAGSTHEWLTGISAAAHPVLQRGLGVYAFCYDASNPAAFTVSPPVGSAIPSKEAADTFLKMSAALGTQPEAVERMYCVGPPIAFARDLGKADRAPAAAQHLSRLGWSDALRIRGQAPPARGAMLVVPVREQHAVPPRLRSTLNQIATHLAASFRLRNLAAARIDESDAVFGTHGNLLHLSDTVEAGQGVPALRVGIRRMIEGRKLRREDSQRAVALWAALVAGKWSVFDRFDTDGRQFVVARRNEPDVTDPRMLSDAERRVALYASWGHSQKLIGYELGMSPAVVSGHLTRALRKLGMQHRGALIGLFRASAGKPTQ